jgi:hypothetical protein
MCRVFRTSGECAAADRAVLLITAMSHTNNGPEPPTRQPAARQARPVDSPEPKPWHEPVDGEFLLKRLFALFRRHLVIDQKAALAVALWTIHTYVLAAAETTPRLAVTSPAKRCGKTTLFKVLSYLVYHPEPVSNISPASIFRSIEAEKPTLLIDEGDSFLRDNRELKNVLNSGHTRETAYVKRCVGNDYKPRRFPTWAAVAIALIGRLPETLEDRSIEIRMRRKLGGRILNGSSAAKPDPISQDWHACVHVGRGTISTD